MPRGRQPEGDHALSDAERQARYRARRHAEQTPSRVRYRRPADRRARPQRWHDAVAELLALQAESAAWRDACPTAFVTAPPPRLSRPSSNSILTFSLKSSPRAALGAIDA